MEFKRRLPGRPLDVAFLAGFLAYAYAGIDTRLIYHWQMPALYMTAGFAFDFLKYPGGILDYLYVLIAQTYVSQLGGALVLTGIAAAVTALSAFFCRTWPIVRFVPGILLLYCLNLYYDHTPVSTALLLGLGAAALLLRSNQKAPLWKFIALVPVVYYLGGMALVVFAITAAGMQIARREYAKSVACLLLAAAVPFAVEKSRLIHIASSAGGWFIDPDSRKAAVWWCLYLFCGVAGFLWGRPVGEPKRKPTVKRTPAPRLWWSAAGAAAVLACMAAVAVFAWRANARDRRLAEIDYYTSHENWPEVIAVTSNLPAADFNSLTRYEVNLALYELNRLGDEMFRFPQTGSMVPGLRTEVFLPYMIRVTDLFLRLGRINDAEHFGNEAIILGQSDPRVLRLMADLNMVKGQTEAARKFLATLSEEAGSARWARGRLQELNHDADLSRYEPVQRLRRKMLRSDDLGPVWQNPDKPGADVNRLLLDQLEQDPTNRMAFEFLIGNYLLARDLPAARGVMPGIQSMTGAAYIGADGKRRTPRYYQEAMAMYGDASGKPVELPGLEIEPETLNRMAVFKRIMSQSANRDAAMQAAWSSFRDSYFFYYVFGPGDYR